MEKSSKVTWIRLIHLVFVISCLIFFGCEQERFLNGSDTLIGSDLSDFTNKVEIGPSLATDVEIKAQEDWQNINDALNNASPGDVVELGAGSFYLHKSIVRWDFNGTLRGAGKDETTIQTAPGIMFDVSENPLLEWAGNWTTEGHSMFCFPQHFSTEDRTIILSDLTIIVNEPTTPWIDNVHGAGGNPNTFNCLSAFTVYNEGLDNDLANKIPLNVYYKDIAFIGEDDPKYTGVYGTNYSMPGAIETMGASSGEVEVDNVTITNSGVALYIHVYNGEGSTVTVTNSNVEYAAFALYSWKAHSWLVSNNEVKNCSLNSFLMQSGGLPNGSSIIEDNMIIMDAGRFGINGFRMNNVMVRDNTFIGNGSIGIRARYGDNWEIIDNDLCGFTPNNPNGVTIGFFGNLNSIVEDNANQVVGGSSASDLSNYIGEAKECDIN